MKRLLWYIVIAGLLAGLPLIYERIATERSADQIEVVFDYHDLLEVSAFRPNPVSYVEDQLKLMKASGVTSMTVYESSLEELNLSGSITLLKSSEAAQLTGALAPVNENYTYVLFSNPAAEQTLKPIIEKAFSDLKVTVEPWSYKQQNGLIIKMQKDEAVLKLMEPDPIALKSIHDKGFQIVIRLSDRRLPFKEQEMDRLLSELNLMGVQHIMVAGDAVPGYADKAIPTMAKLLNKHKIGLVAVEQPVKVDQKGFNTLANLLNYNVVRMHYLSEKDVLATPAVISDRLVLAVKDRNIRMLYFHIKAEIDPDKGTLSIPLDNLYKSLSGPGGAVPRIQDAGYKLDVAQPFTVHNAPGAKILKLVVIFGAVSFIALTIALFFPSWLLPLFLIGIVGALALYFRSSSLLLQAAALGVGVCAPVLAIITAAQNIRKKRDKVADGAGTIRSQSVFSILLLIKTTLISLIGMVFVVSLLNKITYMLVLEQFRGVSILHLLPIVITAFYLAFFYRGAPIRQIGRDIRQLLMTNIRIWYIIAAGVILAGAYYYLTRTGNNGQVSPYEKIFRSLLEDKLGVRPRTKEFLFAHPLFVLGAYLALRYRNAIYLLLIGVVGQLSIVDTFAHLHTPFATSLIRISYGVIIGAVIGLIYIAVWELLVRSWKKWVPSLTD